MRSSKEIQFPPALSLSLQSPGEKRKVREGGGRGGREREGRGKGEGRRDARGTPAVPACGGLNLPSPSTKLESKAFKMTLVRPQLQPQVGCNCMKDLQ